ncbi:MAG TPA: hypothetical protein VN442_09110 [Bryobacteraceae bacterium]|nr:hypothetical protein [Bryobacteraceae bacterium]
MRFLLTIAAVPLVAGMSLAQNTPSQNTQQPENPPAAGSQKRETGAQPTTRTPSTTETQSQTEARPAEMKTQTYKGVLTDASCAMPGSAARTGSTQTESSSSAAADRTSSTASQSETRSSEQMRQSDANRTATGGQSQSEKSQMGQMGQAQSGQAQSCPVTASTSAFALKMNDGRVVGFDSVGNQRAQEAIKNKKKWSEATTSGKPIKAKVDGVLTGDKLLVVSIR